MTDKVMIIDGDGHVMEPEDLWTSRMDAARWGDWIPHKVIEDEIYETVYTGGVVRGGGRELQDRMAAAVGMTSAVPSGKTARTSRTRIDSFTFSLRFCRRGGKFLPGYMRYKRRDLFSLVYLDFNALAMTV